MFSETGGHKIVLYVTEPVILPLSSNTSVVHLLSERFVALGKKWNDTNLATPLPSPLACRSCS
jgi:hypothetical protein